MKLADLPGARVPWSLPMSMSVSGPVAVTVPRLAMDAGLLGVAPQVRVPLADLGEDVVGMQ